MSDVYRKSAVERLSSPEQLDKALVITSPLSWLALVGVALIFAAVVFWSIVGDLPTMTKVNGVFINSERVSSLNFLDEENNIVICYVPLSEGKSFQVGMEALITPLSVNRQNSGHMEGVIFYIDEYITSVDSIIATLGDDNMLAEQFLRYGPVVAVVCMLREDKNSHNGFYWSNKNGRNVQLSEGMLVAVDIITERTAPISKVFPAIRRGE